MSRGYELNPFEDIPVAPLNVEQDDDNWYGLTINGEYPSYDLLIKSVSDFVTWTVIAGNEDYQGDYYAFGEDQKGNYYYVTTGYGSCSGCDELEACQTVEDLEKLRADIRRGVARFDSIETFVNHFKEDEWQSFGWMGSDMKLFNKEMFKHYKITLLTEED